MPVSDPYFITSDPAGPDSQARHLMIREAAYFLAQHRGFLPGLELEDWLQAEKDIDAALAAAQRNGPRDI